MSRKPRNALLSLLLTTIAASAQFEPVTCKNSFTQEQEIAEGNKVVAEVYKQMPVLPDTDAVAVYIQQLGAKLVAVAPLTPGLEQQWPFRFHVVADESINAFALPGGTMFVNLGAINAAENESQLAGVMGHEMSHVIMRHSTCNMSKEKKRGIWYGIAEIGSQVALGSTVGGLAAEGIGQGEQLEFLHMSRGDEKQADLLGVQISHNAGFDPRGLPQFFEIITAKYGKGGAQFLSDHPNPGNRTEYVDQEIALLTPLENPIVTSPQFTAIHKIAATRRTFTAQQMKSGEWKSLGVYASSPSSGSGMAPSPSAATPAVAESAAPAARETVSVPQPTAAPEAAAAAPAPEPSPQHTPLPKPAEPPQPPSANLPGATTAERLPADQLAADTHLVTVPLSHGGSIDAPPTWRMTNQPDGSIALAPRRAAGTFGISYGVLIGAAPDKSNTTAALTVASDRLARQLLKSHALKPNGGTSNFTIAGQPALSRELVGTSPVSEGSTPLPEHDWLITLPRPDGTLGYLIFVAPEPDFSTLQPLFDSMLQSYKPQ